MELVDRHLKDYRFKCDDNFHVPRSVSSQEEFEAVRSKITGYQGCYASHLAKSYNIKSALEVPFEDLSSEQYAQYKARLKDQQEIDHRAELENKRLEEEINVFIDFVRRLTR